MTRTAEKIDTLVSEDSSMSAALDTIREEADANGGEVEWGDVRDDLTSGQWGRLIETGLLVDGDEGFEIADREAYDEALDGDGGVADGVPDVEIEKDTSWSQWDKMAGITAFLMMIGYWSSSVRDTLGSSLNIVLGPLDAAMPFYMVILAIALLTGLYSSLLQANLMDPEVIGKYQERMKSMQSKQKELREEKKEAKERGASEAELDRIDNELDKAREEQMEAMTENIGMFKEQFRPMVWIMLLTLPLFLWMYWMILDGNITEAERVMVMPLIGEVGLDEGLLGPMWAWIIWYFLCSMGFTQLLRKSLNIDMTPTGT